MMLYNYAVYVSPEQDYAVVQFKQKSDQRDSAIGYSKAAMVFHMLRREIGDVAFFGRVEAYRRPNTEAGAPGGTNLKSCSARPRPGICVRSSPGGSNSPAL